MKIQDKINQSVSTINYLGYSESDLLDTVNNLNQLLANYHVYYQNLRNFHWNIAGRSFFDLHEKFELLYNDAREKIDEIAERILTLRHHPISRLTDYLNFSTVKESKILHSDTEMVSTILKDHKEIITTMRTTIESAGKAGDEGTIDMVGGFLANLEKQSWMLDAWLQNQDDKVSKES